MIEFLNVAKQNTEVDLLTAYARVLKSNKYSLGLEVAAFEQTWAKFCGAEYCNGVGNGYDALKLILMAHSVGKGNSVIVAANTHIATWYAVNEVGAEIIAVEPKYKHGYCLALEEIKETVDKLDYESRKKLKAVLITQLYGSYNGIRELEQFVIDNDLFLFVDACQSHGGYNVHGHAAAYSFYPTKNLGAIGDGGAVVTNNKDVYETINFLRNYGSHVQNEHYYRYACNSRLDELQAAFLRAKLHRLNEWNDRRLDHAAFYNSRFKNLPVQLPSLKDSVFHQYVIQLDSRDRFREWMDTNGIRTMIHYPTAPHMQPAFCGYKFWDLRETEAMTKRIVSLPIGPELTRSEVETVAEIVRAYQW